MSTDSLMRLSRLDNHWNIGKVDQLASEADVVHDIISFPDHVLLLAKFGPGPDRDAARSIK